MRKIADILCILIFILLPTNIYADMGPKPSVVLDFYGLNSEKCYVTLLSKEDSSGPWSVYKNTEDSKRIMENMGGGGHFSMAAAQFENRSIEDVRLLLEEKIKEYLDDRGEV